jgi:hypothetical protein
LPLRSAFALNTTLTVAITCTMATTVILDWGTPAGAPASSSGTGLQTWNIASAAMGAAFTASQVASGGPIYCSLWNGGTSAIYVQVGVDFILGCPNGLTTYWANQSTSGYPAQDAFQLYFQLQNPAVVSTPSTTNDMAFANSEVGGPNNAGATALVYLNNPTNTKNKMNPSTGQAVDLIFNAPTTVDYSQSGSIVVEFVGTSY